MTDASKKGVKSSRKSTGKASEQGAGATRSRESSPLTAPADEFTGPARVYAFADSIQKREAEAAEADKRSERLETWVSFFLAGEAFALPVTAVRELLRVSTITRVPHAPFPVRGIINMRGRVVPVVDLRVRLGLPQAELGPASRILIASSRDRLLGFLVDAVLEVVSLDLNAVEAPPADVMTEQSEYIIGLYHLGDRLLILLDVGRVLLIPDSLQPTAPT